MMRLLLIICCFFHQTLLAQFVIRNGTQVGFTAGTQINIISPGDVVNETNVDFSTADVNLALTGAALNVTGNFVLKNLYLEGTGPYDLNGNLIITEGINFVNGVLDVPASSQVLFRGAAEGIVADGTISYINGAFYQIGQGNRKFPVGKGGMFLPLEFTGISIDDTVGIEAFNQSPQLQTNLDIVEIDPTRFWRIYCDNYASINSNVYLSVFGINPDEGGSLIAVEGNPPINNIALDLGNEGVVNDMVRSTRPVTQPVLGLGRTSEVKLKIHDLITPFGNSTGENDALYVSNLFENNRITFMDRWGVVLKEWVNYDNQAPDLEFFKSLAPGNYICVVQATNLSGHVYTAQQMVTVLKTN